MDDPQLFVVVVVLFCFVLFCFVLFFVFLVARIKVTTAMSSFTLQA